jgi:hypothetical protein
VISAWGSPLALPLLGEKDDDEPCLRVASSRGGGVISQDMNSKELAMSRFRNYWIYSLGLAIAWAIVLTIVYATKPEIAPNLLLVFLGFFICWISTTIARYVYPPAKRWRATTAQRETDLT